MFEININKKYWILIAKYLSGNASENEKKEFDLWLNHSENSKKLFDQISEVWLKSNEFSDILNIDTDKAWNKFKSKLYSQSFTNKNENNKLKILVKNTIKIAAVVIIGLVSWFFISNLQYKTTVNTTNDLKQIVLYDGSVIELNRNTSITYPRRFINNSREVKLNKGEAFFSIAHNAKKPFIIHTSKNDIKVLGTSFNVNTLTGGELEVIVRTGRVEVKDIKTKETVVIGKDEKAYYMDNKLVKSINTDINYLSWKTHSFIFRQDRLDYVCQTIEKAYSLKINYSFDIGGCRLTAKYENMPIDDIIKVIGLTFGFKTQKTKDGYVIIGNNCNKSE